MTIKHLVLSGGGPAGLIMYGALTELKQNKFWKLDNIKTIYGCSVGTILGVVTLLDYNTEWIDDYLIKRPWDKVISIEADKILGILDNKGVYGQELIDTLIGPLLDAKDISKDITLQEFYDITKVKFVLVTIDLNKPNLEAIFISYETHPDLSLLTGLAMSCAYPIIMRPVEINDKCYIDGGLICNLPLTACLDKEKCNEKEVLGLNIISRQGNRIVTPDEGAVEFLKTLVWKVHKHIDTSQSQPLISYMMNCRAIGCTNIDKWYESLDKSSVREEMIKIGREQARDFLVHVDIDTLDRRSEELTESI